ncbi:MAG: DMT family transporter [Acidimicrobiales bacterium]
MSTTPAPVPTGVDGDGAAPRRTLGYGAAVGALVFWGGQAVIAKGVELDPLPLVFYRVWLAVVWSVGMLYLTGGRLSRVLLRRSLLGGIAFGLDLVLFFTALKLTTVANTTVIASLQPVLLVFAAPLLFHEKIKLHEILLAAVAIVGVVLVVFGATGLPEWSARGDVWALATLFAWTGYFMASKAARAQLSAVEFTAGATLIAAVVVTPFAALSGQDWGPPTAANWFWIAMMAIGPGWAGHYLMNWALGHVPIWFGGCVALASPVASAVMAALFLDEHVTLLQGLGMAVTVASLIAMTVIGALLAPSPATVAGADT